MTALKKFERLESLGLWKETETSQKKEVIVSFGKASLVLSDNKDTPLTHWALGAVKISTAEGEKVIYTPDKNGVETLEISDATMNRAIAKVQKAIRKPRSHRGRIRMLSTALILICFSLLAVFWLPNALADYTISVVSDAKAREIGAKLMPHFNQYMGRPCRSSISDPVVRKLENRLSSPNRITLFIADLGARYSTRLPGGIIVANQSLVENHPGPEILAGFVLMEKTLQERNPALRELILQAGPIANFSFLITGEISYDVLATFAKNRITQPLVQPDATDLLRHFKVADISSTPFAKVLSNQQLIDEDPIKDQYEPILTDPEWLVLQSICEG